MTLNNFFGLAIFALAIFSADCFSEMNRAGIPNVDLGASTDPDVRAAGQANQAAANYELAKIAEEGIIDPININNGKDMDFTRIDKLIRQDPYSDRYYLEKAAMSVAAGKDDSEVRRLTGQGYDAAKDPTKDFIDAWLDVESDRRYEIHYITALARVQAMATHNGEAWQRTHAELCAQVALYKSKFEVPLVQQGSNAVVANELGKYKC